MGRKRARKIKKLHVEKLDSSALSKLKIDDDPGWYIHDPNGEEQWLGPYSTKAEAIEDRQGLERFWRYEAV